MSISSFPCHCLCLLSKAFTMCNLNYDKGLLSDASPEVFFLPVPAPFFHQKTICFFSLFKFLNKVPLPLHRKQNVYNLFIAQLFSHPSLLPLSLFHNNIIILFSLSYYAVLIQSPYLYAFVLIDPSTCLCVSFLFLKPNSSTTISGWSLCTNLR